jgi:uncharacterized membrane protein YgdD (TMEM256/DUF423 family)
MRWDRRTWMTLAALSGLMSVAMGAFAAHGITDPQAKDWIKTGASYQFMHAIASIACAAFMQVGAKRARFAPALFLSGTLLFSGSLYAMALGAPKATAAMTPVGGLFFLIGWAVLAWAARGVDQAPVAAVLNGRARP